ncbi:hypothetical protein BN2537_2031 [Streptomyces venezuelae]|nr:hypothetical protein BN2537_2031 [Streptomyces venezuelae]
MASFRGRAGGTTRATLDVSQTVKTPLPCTSKGMYTPERRDRNEPIPAH